MSQLKRKFIEDNAVSGAKFRLDNNELLRGRNSAGNSDVGILKITTADDIEFQKVPFVNDAVPVPSAPKELATVEYVENRTSGRTDAKDAAHALADSNIALTGTAPLTVDGYSFGASTATPPARIALTGQTDAVQNGVYIYSVSGGNYTLTRATDFSGTNVSSGAYFRVINGTVYSGYDVVLTTSDPIVIGTTALTFARYPSTVSITGGDMIDKTNNVLSVDLATLSGLESTNPGGANGQLRVKTDTASLEKDQTTRRDSSTGATVAKKSKKETFTLVSGDITNGYIDLQNVAGQDSVQLFISGAGAQIESDDFTVNYTGGTSSKTRVTFAGGLAVGGVSALVANDRISVAYKAF